MCMATGRYPHWTLGAFSVTLKPRKLSWLSQVCRHDTLPFVISCVLCSGAMLRTESYRRLGLRFKHEFIKITIAF